MEIHRLEEIQEYPRERVTVSYKIDRYGIYQIAWEGTHKKELSGEPRFDTLKREERKYIFYTLPIIWRMCFDWDKNL